MLKNQVTLSCPVIWPSPNLAMSITTYAFSTKLSLRRLWVVQIDIVPRAKLLARAP